MPNDDIGIDEVWDYCNEYDGLDAELHPEFDDLSEEVLCLSL